MMSTSFEAREVEGQFRRRFLLEQVFNESCDVGCYILRFLPGKKGKFFTLLSAARYGHLYLVQHFARVGQWPYGQVIRHEFDDGTCIEYTEYLASRCLTMSAEYGQLHICKWIHDTEFKCSVKHANMAAFGGHLDVLMWMRIIGIEINETGIQYAKQFQYVHILDWFYSGKQ
jgi:hypothetical protein